METTVFFATSIVTVASLTPSNPFALHAYTAVVPSLLVSVHSALFSLKSSALNATASAGLLSFFGSSATVGVFATKLDPTRRTATKNAHIAITALRAIFAASLIWLPSNN